MNKIIVMLTLGLLTQQTNQAQGTVTYLSNLGRPSVGSIPVGNDSWWAASFRTGTNASGYTLDSIQLAMTDASGIPNEFTVMLYSFGIGAHPGTSLDTLDGSLNPMTGGIFVYTPSTSLVLSQFTSYFIVLTAGTAVVDGAYNWSYATGGYNHSGGWNAPVAGSGIDNFQSFDGVNWSYVSYFPQFAINVTDVPEPGVLGLFGLGGLAFLWHHRKSKAV